MRAVVGCRFPSIAPLWSPPARDHVFSGGHLQGVQHGVCQDAHACQGGWRAGGRGGGDSQTALERLSLAFLASSCRSCPCGPLRVSRVSLRRSSTCSSSMPSPQQRSRCAMRKAGAPCSRGADFTHIALTTLGLLCTLAVCLHACCGVLPLQRLPGGLSFKHRVLRAYK